MLSKYFYTCAILLSIKHLFFLEFMGRLNYTFNYQHI